MNRIFYDYIDVFTVVYIDDLMIFSMDPQSHLGDLNTVFSSLTDHKLYVSPKNCEFMNSELLFLSMIIGKNIQVDPKEVKVLREWPKPKTLTDVNNLWV